MDRVPKSKAKLVFRIPHTSESEMLMLLADALIYLQSAYGFQSNTHDDDMARQFARLNQQLAAAPSHPHVEQLPTRHGRAASTMHWLN